MAGVTELLERARSQGLEIRCEGGELVIRGPRALEPLALELLARKEEVLRLLEEEERAPEFRPCPACGSRTWWLAGRNWRCATCHPPALPEEAVRLLVPLRSLREALAAAVLELAEAAGWPRLPLEPHRAVAPGMGSWKAWARQAAVPDLRRAAELLREGLGLRNGSRAREAADAP